MTIRAPMRCSALADELGEPMAGTVDHRERWILVEDRSAWGERAVRDVLGAELEVAAKARRIRLLLVRRREGDPAADAVRRVMVVDTAARRMAVRTVTAVDEVHALLDADLADVGAPMTDPILLVCTNGKLDACCALRGRSVVAALAADHAERTWECTHLGGHRFAGNLVCLPDGIVYGRVAAADAARLADAYLAGRLDPAFLRGRSAWPAPAQVAEAWLRDVTSLDGLDDLRLDRVEVTDDRAEVTLLARGGATHAIRLVREPHRPPRPISCRGTDAEEPVHWRVADR